MCAMRDRRKNACSELKYRSVKVRLLLCAGESNGTSGVKETIHSYTLTYGAMMKILNVRLNGYEKKVCHNIRL